MVRFDLNKSSWFYSRWSKATRSVADLFYNYLIIISRSLFHKEVRTYLKVRLSNPGWYRHHLKVVRKRLVK